MAQQIEITARKRTRLGKGANRRMRRLEKRLPGVIYGGKGENLPITLDFTELDKAMEQEAFFSQIVTLKTDDGAQPAVVRDIQRNPARDFVTHIDFQRVEVGEEIDLRIPLHFINEESCVGVKEGGGSILHNLNEVEVRCLPGNLPEYIEVDVGGLAVGESVHLSDLTLPQQVQIVALTYGEDHDQVVAHVEPPRRAAVAEEEEEVAAEQEGTAEASGGTSSSES